MGMCMSLFYDTSECQWAEKDLAQAVLQGSREEHKHPCVDNINDLRFPDDYTELRPIPACSDLQPSSGGKYLAWEFAPRVFRFFRESPRFCNCISPQEWEDSWLDTVRSRQENTKGSTGTGKSGATFLKSNDRHWMIKTIDIKEVRKQITMLHEYVMHFDKHPNSLLMRHLQLLKLQEQRYEGGGGTVTKYLIVFENTADSADLRCPKQDPADTFISNVWDLKGRQPKPGKLPQPGSFPSGKQGKDNHLARSFALTPEVWEELIGDQNRPGQLKHDAEFLSRHNLIDYSLLIHTWPSCAAEHKSDLPPKLTLDQKWLLSSAYDQDSGMCADAAEGLYLPRRQLLALELREARMSSGPWKGSWEPPQHHEQRQMLELEPTRKCPVRVGRRYPVRTGDDRRGRVHKYHNGIVSANGDEIYFIGIIDILTGYHRWKRCANCCKKFAFFEDQLSTIPAPKYEARFSRFLRQDVFPDLRETGQAGYFAFPAPAPPVGDGDVQLSASRARREEWLLHGGGAGRGPRGHDEFLLNDKRERGGQEVAEWVSLASCRDEAQWQKLRKRRNCLRWQYAKVREGVRDDLRRAVEQRGVIQMGSVAVQVE